MIINTNRLQLIACTPEFLSTISPEDYEIGDHVKGHIAELQDDDSQFGWGVWFVVDQETNTIVGDIGFKGKPTSDKTVEIGYGIIPSAQNKGYATEAVRALVEWAFASGRVKKIVAECLHHNLASIKVLEKLGMKRTGLDGDMMNWEMPQVNGEPS
ncbi:GNAT family N-acetyltransferase [Sporosarcina sp. ACRSL]|uniref:GNAT family N-acetyltransferase n=1 Tax=Sporosarcina sp. ACRSL TaxID=2918215 RepID=UPI001EF55AC8|nr:GNAT family N-acetyltransferase [Sporosarcina sp. ACRSL]MCG7343209.1 GNAT family N-acetyltransferase [Sporosarcina sp. ACRSL]